MRKAYKEIDIPETLINESAIEFYVAQVKLEKELHPQPRQSMSPLNRPANAAAVNQRYNNIYERALSLQERLKR